MCGNISIKWIRRYLCHCGFLHSAFLSICPQNASKKLMPRDEQRGEQTRAGSDAEDRAILRSPTEGDFCTLTRAFGERANTGNTPRGATQGPAPAGAFAHLLHLIAPLSFPTAAASASSLLSTRSFPSSGRHSTTSRRRRRAVSQHLPACPRPAKRSLSHVVKIMFVRAGNRPCTLFVHLDVATADVRGNKAAKASPRVNPCGSARVRKPERCKLYFELSIFRRDARVALWRHCSLTQ